MSTLLCRVELNKNSGITITVDNSNGEICHTMIINDNAITLRSESANNTSVITQTPEKIAINCKAFELKADTIVCDSETTTQLSAGEDFKVTSNSNINLTANQSADIKGSNINLTGSAEIKAQAAIINLQ